MRLVYVCEGEEKEVTRQEAPGACPKCGGKVEALRLPSIHGVDDDMLEESWNKRCHLLPSPPSRPEPHPTTAAIPIPGLSCSCGTTDLHLPPFSIAAGVGSSTIADAVGEENRRPSPPNLHHPLVYSSGDQGAANQFHRHLPPSLSVSLSLPDSCCQRRKAAFTIELEASPSLKNTSTTVASPTRLHLSNRTADLLFFPSSEIGPGRGVDRVPSLVPDSNRFHAC
ncbi:hypothetical protein LXL04_002965 [Taraxacum kok-saghyz]